MRLYTPTLNSEWLPGYKLVISCPGVLQQKIQCFALGQSALYFCCSTPGQDITNTYTHMIRLLHLIHYTLPLPVHTYLGSSVMIALRR